MNENFNGVQFLRFFAALLVVITHATGAVAERMLGLGGGQYWRAGLSGVDIFFVISGFVMIVSSRNLHRQAAPWKYFLVRRLVRVVPLYWAATSAKILLSVLMPKLALHAKLAIPFLVCSYLFIPARNYDGELLPILTVGWTLIYELYFYVIFSIALYFRFRPSSFVSVFFIVVTAAGLVFPPENDQIRYFANPIILEFCMGMFLAKLYQEGKRAPLAVCVAVIVLALALLTAIGYESMQARVLFYGVPAMLLVAAFVFGERWFGFYIPKCFVRLGDSSYSLYLFHPFVVPAAVMVLVKSGVVNPAIAVVVCCLASIAAGWIIYVVVEKPLLNYMKSKV